MKFKWYYAMLPACVSFGPFFMSNMGGLNEPQWWIPMFGVVLVTVGLGGMLRIVFAHHKVLDELLEQQKQGVSKE